MQLDRLAKGVEEGFRRTKDALVHHQITAFGRSRDERSGAAGLATCEIIQTHARRLDKGHDLCLESIQIARAHHIVHHACAIFFEALDDDLWVTSGFDMLQFRHDSSPRVAVARNKRFCRAKGKSSCHRRLTCLPSAPSRTMRMKELSNWHA